VLTWSRTTSPSPSATDLPSASRCPASASSRRLSAFALDRLGDIYLDARLPLSAVGPEEVDRLLGSVLTYADESFNTILELGFASSIRKEWEWRHLRGESTANLEAFRGWLESGADP
jgi:hypothetical protein